MDEGSIRQHVTILGWVNLVLSAFFIFLGVFVLFFLSGLGRLVDDPEAAGILGFVGVALALFLIVISLPGLLAGYGLLKRRSWGRILGLIVAVIDLINFPFGTVLGIYGLWVLTDEQARAHFSA